MNAHNDYNKDAHNDYNKDAHNDYNKDTHNRREGRTVPVATLSPRE